MSHPRRRYSDRIFDAIPGYVTVQDRDFLITEANETFRRDFGNFEGRYCYQVYKHRPEKCEDCPVERTFHDGQTHRSEEIVKTLDGREVSVIVYTTPILNEAGEVMEVIEASTDITQIKQLQIQLQDSQARYQQLFEEVPCFISIQDKDLRIVDANRLHRETFGVGYGHKCYKIYKHRTKECLPCTVRQTFADGESRIHEEVVTSQKNERINVQVHTAALRNSAGEIDKVIEMSADITQIRQLQSKLTSIGLLISSISHSLKGLLSSLDGGFYLMDTGFKKDNPDRVKKGWEIAQRNIDRIKSTVMDILYYAKDRELDWEDLPANDLLGEIHDILKSKADNLNIELKLECDEKSGKIMVDHKAVRSMLVNLVENSLDACRVDNKKDRHSVSMSTRNFADYVEFEISDNGIGMDQQTREKAFSMFFSSKGAEGTGLGLFISNKIAQEHGGSIKVESESGKGTRFVVKMPKKQLEKTTISSDIDENEEDT